VQVKSALLPRVDFAKSTCRAREAQYVHWTETIANGDPRAAWFDNAKQEEILSLIGRGTFGVEIEEEARVANDDTKPASMQV
jgi:hypothetical protein